MDITQDTFLKVHRRLDSFEGESAFFTWVYRIAMNLSIDHLRRRKRQAREDLDDALRSIDAASEEALPLSGRLASDPSRTLDDQELSRQLHAALDQLPEIHRQVILLRELENLSYADIAQVLNISKGTVMSRLHHARRKLKELLGPYLQPAAGKELDGASGDDARMKASAREDDR